MPSTTIQYFDYEHLPPHLQAVSKKVYKLAHYMEDNLLDSAEKSAGMRKLLEAKDCFVRAAMPTAQPTVPPVSTFPGLKDVVRNADKP